MSYGNQAPPPGGYAAPAAAGGTNVLAIVSLIAGILGLLLLCAFLGPISFVFGVVAAVLGFVARNQIKQRGQGGSGLAMAGLVIGIAAAVLGLAELAGLAALIGLASVATPSP
jgi:Domain of unknown function (DUF4190)